MDYYQELLDEPERMVAVFDTMKPVRDERNKITGYVVGIEGEKDFFEAVGLRQGDIVRSVNSIPMTNRKRAEFLIDEFIKDNMSAVVMDVERGGQPVKQVYQLRH
jgi:type II secretory pathway component PulC